MSVPFSGALCSLFVRAAGVMTGVTAGLIVKFCATPQLM
jgi:hypothetical protein